MAQARRKSGAKQKCAKEKGEPHYLRRYIARARGKSGNAEDEGRSDGESRRTIGSRERETTPKKILRRIRSIRRRKPLVCTWDAPISIARRPKLECRSERGPHIERFTPERPRHCTLMSRIPRITWFCKPVKTQNPIKPH